MRRRLTAANKSRLMSDFEQLEVDIKARRDNITHYARGASWINDGRIYIPLRQQRNVRWTVEQKAESGLRRCLRQKQI